MLAFRWPSAVADRFKHVLFTLLVLLVVGAVIVLGINSGTVVRLLVGEACRCSLCAGFGGNRRRFSALEKQTN